MSTFCDNSWYEIIPCATCGIKFALPQEFVTKRRNDCRDFYCPSGHILSYRETEATRLRKRLEDEQRKTSRAESKAAQAEVRAKAVNRQYKRIRDRVKNGVCPCCDRTFSNFAEHMKTQHADFGSHDLLKALREAYGLTQGKLAEEIWVRPDQISLYENNKQVPEQAQTRIESWLAQQVA